jgi:hypothetical protein
VINPTLYRSACHQRAAERFQQRAEVVLVGNDEQ